MIVLAPTGKARWLAQCRVAKVSKSQSPLLGRNTSQGACPPLCLGAGTTKRLTVIDSLPQLWGRQGGQGEGFHPFAKVKEVFFCYLMEDGGKNNHPLKKNSLFVYLVDEWREKITILEEFKQFFYPCGWMEGKN